MSEYNKKLAKLEIEDFYGEFTIENAKTFYQSGFDNALASVKYNKRMLKAVEQIEKDENENRNSRK